MPALGIRLFKTFQSLSSVDAPVHMMFDSSLIPTSLFPILRASASVEVTKAAISDQTLLPATLSSGERV